MVIAVGFVVLLAWGNLRGLRESGQIFAIPTYLYVVGMAVVVVLGIWRWAFGGLGSITYNVVERPQLEGFGAAALVPVSLFLILHAFSAGVTALTGVEAISNGVSAFRQPQARNARTTLVGMAMALVLNERFVGRGILRSIMLVPGTQSMVKVSPGLNCFCSEKIPLMRSRPGINWDISFFGELSSTPRVKSLPSSLASISRSIADGCSPAACNSESFRRWHPMFCQGFSRCCSGAFRTCACSCARRRPSR